VQCELPANSHLRDGDRDGNANQPGHNGQGTPGWTVRQC
jgi:hypothetical protein